VSTLGQEKQPASGSKSAPDAIQSKCIVPPNDRRAVTENASDILDAATVNEKVNSERVAEFVRTAAAHLRLAEDRHHRPSAVADHAFDRTVAGPEELRALRTTGVPHRLFMPSGT